MSGATPITASNPIVIRAVALDQAWVWLAAGWADLGRAPTTSLAFGLAIIAISYALIAMLFVLGWVHLALPLAAGFSFLAPILAIAFYDISRRLDAGRPVSIAAVAAAWRPNMVQIAWLGLMLLLLHLAWIRVATLLFALFFHDVSVPIDDPLTLMLSLLLSGTSLPFLITGTVIGAGLAAIAFAISAVSVPMLLDRDVDAVSAILTSIEAVRQNWKPMALWAVLIAFFTLAGLATFCLGLAVTMPLIGHATWHAYRDLVV
jgi:uncharacterized membrane protein